MKRFFTLLFSVVVYLTLHAHQAFYVYRNDGNVNGFLSSEVDSIRCSRMGMDSILYENFQVQEIWMQDTVVRIPLSLIDSVSFITPETIYQNGVINLSEGWMQYVLYTDSMTIWFDNAMPITMLPQVDDKLVTLEMNELFPSGFAGKVVDVIPSDTGYVVKCEYVNLEEIFEQYYNVSSAYGYAEVDPSGTQVAIRKLDSFGDITTTLPTINFDYGRDLQRAKTTMADLALVGEISGSLSIKPTLHAITTVIIDNKHGFYVNTFCSVDLDVSEKIALYGGLTWSHDFTWVSKSTPIPVAPFVSIYIECGLSIGADAKLEFSANFEQNFVIGGLFEYSSNNENVLKPQTIGAIKSHSETISGSLDGSVSIGPYVEVGFAIGDARIDKVGARADAGVNFSGSAVLMKSDINSDNRSTAAFNKLKESSISCNLFLRNSFVAQVLSNKEWVSSEGQYINRSITLNDWSLVPSFSNVSFTRKWKQTTANANFSLNGDCLFPVDVGVLVMDENENEVASQTIYSSYRNGNKNWNDQITSLGENGSYTLYPTVKFMGFDLLASPFAQLEETKPVEIYNIKTTSKQYSPNNDFEYNEKKYSYAFDCEVSVRLNEDTTDIVDWGYVYVDPDGNETMISLKSFGTDYTDNRYIYYRELPISTATWRPYVQYTNEGLIMLQDTIYSLDYSGCIDDSHPHPVDLGLTSGTKWCCCNVGADLPINNGGYFAYGETSEKKSYTKNTYLYYEYYGTVDYMVYDGYTNIGTRCDIAGSIAYDAATSIMGNKWKMPNKDQCQELIDECTWTWCTNKGIQGYLVTGKNGNCIFFPAAGFKSGNNHDKNSERGIYRSSVWTTGSYVGDSSYVIGFTKDGVKLEKSGYRVNGLTIRPVYVDE